jgi:hypothetical protein
MTKWIVHVIMLGVNSAFIFSAPSDLSNDISPIQTVFLSVQSNPQQLFYERLQNLLLPSHTYGVVSGGDPAYIPDLTWKKLKEFHSHHYHPSNARFLDYLPVVLLVPSICLR